MIANKAIIIVFLLSILLVFAWLLHSIFISPLIDKKVEQKSHEEFEKDWNTYMERGIHNG